jgi:hypothetical protein
MPQEVMDNIGQLAAAKGSTFYEVLQEIIDMDLEPLEKKYRIKES